MIRRPPRSTRTDHSFPTRRSSDLLVCLAEIAGDDRLDQRGTEGAAALRLGNREQAGKEGLVGEVAGAGGHGALAGDLVGKAVLRMRSEEHTSELQSLMRISYAVFCLKKKTYHSSHDS